MKQQDALRKIRHLHDYSIGKGAFAAEAENAASLAKLLMKRYGIAEEQARTPQEHTPERTTWVYWDNLFDKFGLEVRHFCRRGNSCLGDGHIAVIKLDKGEWHVQKPSPTGWIIVTTGKGVQSLGDYLGKNLPKVYSIFRGADQ
jgi:hypothetical protein